jgi:ferrous iron transport protein B
MFFAGSVALPLQSISSAFMLTGVLVGGVFITFFVSKFLSKTVLKGVCSSFTLELPPYRRPQIGKVIIRSVIDRTLHILGRAVVVAAPAGIVIWVLANVKIGGSSILNHCAELLNPFARLLGLDGVILMAFILGLPANEIVIPIILMSYLATGSLVDYESTAQLRDLLVSNGWTWQTAFSVIMFSVMHWPCSTTLITIKNETKSIKWTTLSVLVPTALGILFCFAFNLINIVISRISQ